MYQNLDLFVQKMGEKYEARIFESPGGQADVVFDLPFSPIEIKEFMMRARQGERGAAIIEAARVFGGKLFAAMFDDSEMFGVLRSSIEQTDTPGQGLRIRLRLTDVPELQEFPWEYLYYPTLERFFVLSTDTPIIRYPAISTRIQPVSVEPPLRILVIIAGPSNLAPLDANGEWALIKKAVKPLVDTGNVVLERLENATITALRQTLRSGTYHILHFIGHGDFDKVGNDGVIWFETETGEGHSVSAKLLSTYVQDHDPLKVIVLNACEGGRAAEADPFAGSAQTLVQAGGVPAVVAMQFKISDEAAITFSREFYGALSEGHAIDTSVTESRLAIYSLPDNIEWGTPVLYMRTHDGKLFEIKKEDTVSDKDKEEREESRSGGINFGSFNIGSVGGHVNISEGDINNVNTGGGDYVAGNQTNIAGDNVEGDKIMIWEQVHEKISQLDLDDDEEAFAKSQLAKLEEQDKPEPEQDKVDKALGVLESIAPDIVELIVNIATNPGAAVGSGLRTAIKAWRAARTS